MMAIRSILVACIFRSNALATRWLAPVVAAVPNDHVEPNITLTGHLAEVQEILGNIRSMPSCARLAHETLLNACGTYDRHDDQIYRTTDEAVSAFRNLFAIQLTACDMDIAQQGMPAACKPLLLPLPLSYDARQEISHCLNSLFDAGNYWTSYEHNKHAGEFKCFAMRAELDKEEQYDNLRKMFDAFRSMSDFVQEQSMTMEQLKKATQNFGPHIRKAFEAIQTDNQQLRADIKQTFNQVAQEMSSMSEGVKSLLGSMNQADHGFQEHAARTEVLHSRIASIATDVDLWSTGMVGFREELERLQTHVQLEYQQYLAKIFKGVYELTANISHTNEVVSTIADKVDHINVGMGTGLSKLQDINIAAHDSHEKAQRVQIQLQAMETQAINTRENFQAVEEHVEKLQSWAVTASTALDSLNSVVALFTHFGLHYAIAAGMAMLLLSLIGLNFLHAIAASALLGFPIAHLIIMPLSYLKLFNEPITDSTQGQFGTHWLVLTSATGIGILFGFCIKTAIDRSAARANSRFSSTEYDPASPPVLPFTEIYDI